MTAGSPILPPFFFGATANADFAVSAFDGVSSGGLRALRFVLPASRTVHSGVFPVLAGARADTVVQSGSRDGDMIIAALGRAGPCPGDMPQIMLPKCARL